MEEIKKAKRKGAQSMDFNDILVGSGKKKVPLNTFINAYFNEFNRNYPDNKSEGHCGCITGGQNNSWLIRTLLVSNDDINGSIYMYHDNGMAHYFFYGLPERTGNAGGAFLFAAVPKEIKMDNGKWHIKLCKDYAHDINVSSYMNALNNTPNTVNCQKLTGGVTEDVDLWLIRVKDANGNNDYTYLDQFINCPVSTAYLGFDHPINVGKREKIIEVLQSNVGFPRNLLIFGAPGTGKSYSLKKSLMSST